MKHVKYLLLGLGFLGAVFGFATWAASSEIGFPVFIFGIVVFFAYMLGRAALE